jgi:hypothetical protein
MTAQQATRSAGRLADVARRRKQGKGGR